MSTKKEKKQVAMMWVLTVLIVILIAVMARLFITVVEQRKIQNASAGQKISQMQIQAGQSNR